MIWGLIANFAKGLISPVTEVVKSYQARKTAKLTNELAIASAVTTAKIERISTQQAMDFKWEDTALKNSGWKDEAVLIVILSPMVGCFIPWLQPFIREGFVIMQETLPEYWIHAFYSTIAVSYGLKKWTNIKQLMKGS